jgi:hypothetical protein
MALLISFVVDQYCLMRGCNHSTFFIASIEKLHPELSSRSRLHRYGHKSILGDAKKIIAGKILDRHWVLQCCQAAVASTRAM